jgi:hypothetical protein
MQPYFFPYLGYFDLINQADIWVMYDAAQYIHHGWVNRNRILHPMSGWQYILVPVRKHPHTAPINRIEVAEEMKWESRFFKQLSHYHMDAPYYSEVIRFLEANLAAPERNLSRLNVNLIRATCDCLGIDTPVHVFSERNPAIRTAQGPENVALSICQAYDASEFINPPGGAGLYRAERFAELGIKLTIQDFTNMPYACGRYKFEPALSIIDVMMWNLPEDIKRYLDAFRMNADPNLTEASSPL